jgi:Nucleotidyltransferase domain
MGDAGLRIEKFANRIQLGIIEVQVATKVATRGSAQSMNLARPYAILRRSIDAEVLRVVAGTTEAMTGRHVHRLVGHGSHRTVQLALHRLASEGLLDVRDYPPSKLYTFNREHLASEAVLMLVGIRARLVEQLRSATVEWELAPAHASLFGSAARGDGDEESDIDLLIVRPDEVPAEDERWRAQVDDLRQRVDRWTGNRAAVSEMSESELRALRAAPTPILDELREDAVVLSGTSFRDYVDSLR